MGISAEQLQKAYYERTASAYDAMHNSSEDHEHSQALRYILSISDLWALGSFLDVGSGTGRAVSFLQKHAKTVRGIEPVGALIQKAEANGVPAGTILEGSGYELPFENESFDAVLECGVLHHVAQPARVIDEMLRVAKKAVFLSDSNRFGQGRMAARLLKLGLYKAGMWSAVRFLQTQGKFYYLSEGDGVSYSYSVYDSYEQLAAHTQEIWMLPLTENHSIRSWATPLLTSSHILLCAFKCAPNGYGA